MRIKMFNSCTAPIPTNTPFTGTIEVLLQMASGTPGANAKTTSDKNQNHLTYVFDMKITNTSNKAIKI